MPEGNQAWTKKILLIGVFIPGVKKYWKRYIIVLQFTNGQLQHCYDILNDYGNMSSPTILFVLKRIRQESILNKDQRNNIFGAAFGPGLTMETFILSA